MIKLLSSGLYTSIQDNGRSGFRSIGVPVGGAMDHNSMQIANALVGNSLNAPVIEITGSGPILWFETKSNIAITGANFDLTLNDQSFEMNQVMEIPPKSTLRIGNAKNGLRAYLAVQGEIKVPKVLGSSSLLQDVTDASVLKKGDSVQFKEKRLKESKDTNLTPTSLDHPILEVYQGPDYDKMNEAAQQKLAHGLFKVGRDSNRMAYILEYTGIFYAEEILTAPVQPGTVQLTPSGKLVVLMRDAQTTGGYSRVLQLTAASINILAQKRAGEEVQFKIIDLPSNTPS